MRQALVAATPANVYFRRSLAVGYRKIGLSLAAMQDHARRTRAVPPGLDHPPGAGGDRSPQCRPAETWPASDDDIGQVLVALGDHARAMESLHTALTLFEALATADPTNVELRSFAAETRQRLTALPAETGHLGEAHR